MPNFSLLKSWKFWALFGATLAVTSLLSACTWYVWWVNFVDNYEYGFAYDKFTGGIEPVEHTGWVVRNPFRYDVHRIDSRPYQVSISANQRVLNAKLVRFNPIGIKTFVEWHGRAAGDNKDNLLEILKCYAFDRDEGKDAPFLDVISVLAPNQAGGPSIPVEVKK